MIVFLNGQFIPEAQATVSVFDRGFLYGDGLFEAVRVFRGKPFLWPEHVARFQRGAEFLKIQIPFAPEQLFQHVKKLIELNQLPDAVLRLTLSRGVGERGYSPKGADHPTLVMALHPAPEAGNQPASWRVITASCRLPADEPLAEFKTCNKLPQILARAEADAAGADEALLLNTKGEVAEASSSNLFWVQHDHICTPPLSSGILAGVTRSVVLEICGNLDLRIREASVTPAELLRARGIFLSLSSRGIIEVASLDGHELPRSPLTRQIAAAHHELLISGKR